MGNNTMKTATTTISIKTIRKTPICFQGASRSPPELALPKRARAPKCPPKGVHSARCSLELLQEHLGDDDGDNDYEAG